MTTGATKRPSTGSDGTELAEHLRRWVDSGLISPAQAERILAAEQLPEQLAAEHLAAEQLSPEHLAAERPPAPSRASLVAEALGYVGGVLVLIGAATVAGRYWAQLGVGGRLGVTFGATVLLLGAGAAIPAGRTEVAHRLRSVCWVLSAALLGAGLALLGEEVLHLPGETVALLAAGGTAGYAAVLWWRHRGVLQQAALLAALAVAAGAAAAHLPHGEDAVAGFAVWGVGVVWAVLGWGGVIAARIPAYVLGGAAAVLGAQWTIEIGWGAALAIGTAVALVALGAWLRELVLLGVGSVATLLTVPAVLGQYFPDTLAVPLALAGCGALLVAGAVATAHRRRHGPSPKRPAAGGTRTVASTIAAGVAVAVALAVVALGG